MSAVKNELSTGDKRELRLVLEQYYDQQHIRLQAENRLRNYASFEGLVAVVGEAEADRLKRLGVDEMNKEIRKYKPHKSRDKKTGITTEHPGDPLYIQAFDEAWNRLSDDEGQNKVHELMRKQEAILTKIATQKVNNLPIWQEWLQYVRGVGPIFTAGLVAWFDPYVSPHASAWIKYAGLDSVIEKWMCPACQHEMPHDPAFLKTPVVHCPKCQNAMKNLSHARRRVKGEKAGFSTRSKTLLWKISGSFVKQPAAKSGYRRIYDSYRKKYDEEPCSKIHKNEKGKVIPCFDAHKFAKATRATIKIWLSHAHTMSRRLLGLKHSDPFAFTNLGHDRANLIEPIFDIEPPK